MGALVPRMGPAERAREVAVVAPRERDARREVRGAERQAARWLESLPLRRPATVPPTARRRHPAPVASVPALGTSTPQIVPTATDAPAPATRPGRQTSAPGRHTAPGQSKAAGGKDTAPGQQRKTTTAAAEPA